MPVKISIGKNIKLEWHSIMINCQRRLLKKTREVNQLIIEKTAEDNIKEDMKDLKKNKIYSRKKMLIMENKFISQSPQLLITILLAK